MFHKHKFGEIIEGFQYCETCNTAIPVDCSHKWKILDKYECSNIFSRDGVNSYLYMMQCERCGDLKRVSTQDKL